MIRLERKEDKILTHTPYNQDYIHMIKQIGGKWNSNKKVWEVSEKAETELKKILKKVYGWTEGASTEVVEIEFKANDFDSDDKIKIGTLEIVYRRSRDVSVTIKDGFIVTKGQFPKSAGSRNYPAVLNSDSEDVYIKGEIPAYVYNNLSPEEKEKLKINTEDVFESLKKEEEKLLKRLEEIRKELSKYAENK